MSASVLTPRPPSETAPAAAAQLPNPTPPTTVSEVITASPAHAVPTTPARAETTPAMWLTARRTGAATDRAWCTAAAASPQQASLPHRPHSPVGSLPFSGLPLTYPYGLRVFVTSGSRVRNWAVVGS